MRKRDSNYPVGKLLLNLIEQSGVTPQAFFAELGFTNFSKAIDRLDCWLKHGEGNRLLWERLEGSRFAVDEHQLKKVMAENDALLQQEREAAARRREEEARGDFRPRLDVIAELKRPTQITLFGLTDGNRRFGACLPEDIASWQRNDQLAYVKNAVVESFAKHQGRTFFTGKIEGYLYRPTFDDEPIRLNVTGDIDVRDEPLANSVVGVRFG
ncbi:hypothetical protein [Paraburkholderia diazotrophica]|uniref:Uncharacterized protein n=1 Tax=Paraburkholderia diazotrophica TaxID=667676 RepID=A0A1H7CWX9_9BURK|nr:hypothetical protein [Paraburkholderia diazotrophica]SEJ91240.1 hypothetical protein SAMN05192539_102343 [Paraburkholderia diazotrophica]